MKCICGYEILDDIKALQPPFIPIAIYVHDSQYMGVFHSEEGQKNAYACPKCGTVKVEVKGF